MRARRTAPARVAASAHNDVLAAAYTRATTELEDRLAEILEPILVAEAKRSAAAFQEKATDHLTASALRRADRDAILRSGVSPRDLASLLPMLVAAGALEGVSSTSTMVCVKPRPDEAEAIADPGGAPADGLHVTLAVLVDLDEARLRDLLDALKPVAAGHAPLAGKVGGYGEFRPPGCGILLPDVPGLVELRVAVTEALVGEDIAYARDHGYQPHITVDGKPEDGEIDVMLERTTGAPLHFDAILIVRGDQTVAEIPLVGPRPITASLTAAAPVDPSDVAFRVAQFERAVREMRNALAAGDPVEIAAARAELNDQKEKLQEMLAGATPTWSTPAGDEVVNVKALAEKIRAKTEPVRQALIETTMTPALEKAGLSFDVTNPLTQKALASTGAKVTGISETTRADVMKVVQSAWESGLSIDHTAQMLSVVMQADARTRARTIARTELVGAVNGGSLAATQLVASATGSKYLKSWMTAPGAPHPRHELYDGLDGQTVALDEKFDVGGAPLDHPGDPEGEAGEVINCRCAMRYVDADDEGAAAGPDDTSAAATEPPAEPPPPPPQVEQGGAGDDSYSADIGVTPFRAGEDEPVGFYESDKYGQFVNDVHDSSSSYGVTVDGLDRVTGVWQGDTEPSVSLRIHDGEKGVRAYAANLGNAYHQDGVLIFGDHAAGDVMATFQNALPQDRLTEAMAKAGIDGGRFTADGRLQVIGSGPEFVKQLDSLASDIGPYDASAGRFELLERDSGDYGKAIQAFGPPNSKAIRNTFDEPTMFGEEAAATAAPLTEDAAANALDQAQASFGTSLADSNVSAVNSYLATDYEGVNSALRTGAAVTPYQQRVVDGLDSTIAQAPALAQDTTFWRGITSPETAFGTADIESLVGKTITDPGFGSTTTARKVGVESARGGTVLKILAPAGTQGIWVPGLARSRNIGGEWGILEREFILPRGAQYQVVSAAGDEMTVRLLPKGGG